MGEEGGGYNKNKNVFEVNLISTRVGNQSINQLNSYIASFRTRGLPKALVSVIGIIDLLFALPLAHRLPRGLYE